jgi:hypothetical protein
VFVVLGLLLIPGAWQLGVDFVTRMFEPPVTASP